MKFFDQIKRMRRFLRDPDAKIWSRSFLVDLFNDMQREIQSSSGFLEGAQAIDVPTDYYMSYIYPWEYRFLEQSKKNYFQALRYSEQGGYAFCGYFELQIFADRSGEAAELGANFTQAWEAWNLAPGVEIGIKMPADFHSLSYISWDRKPLKAETKKSIQSEDPSYVVREGEPLCYYIKDDIDKEIVLYPRPTTPAQDVIFDTEIQFVYNYSFESDLLGSNGEKWTRTYNTYEYIHDWEGGNGGLVDSFSHGMFLFEVQTGGVAIYIDGDQADSVSLIASREGDLVSQEEGIAINIIDVDENLFIVYRASPVDIEQDSDEISFPVFFGKYVEHGVLSRAYEANTDGRIVSLADYWRFRHQVDMSMIRRFMLNKRTDRNYLLKSRTIPNTRKRRHPRLPDTYPHVGI